MPAPPPLPWCPHQPPAAIPPMLSTLLSPFKLDPGFRPLFSGFFFDGFNIFFLILFDALNIFFDPSPRSEEGMALNHLILVLSTTMHPLNGPICKSPTKPCFLVVFHIAWGEDDYCAPEVFSELTRSQVCSSSHLGPFSEIQLAIRSHTVLL